MRSPVGSVLGPLLFTAYVSPVGELIESHGVSYHQFADDTQLLVSMDSSDAAPAIDRLAPLLGCSPPVVPAERSAAQRRQVRGRLAWHRCSAPVIRQHHRRRRRQYAACRTATQVAWRDHRLQSTATRETLRRRTCSTLAPCATCAVY